MLRVFLQSRRITGFGDCKTSTGQYQVGKGEQGKKLCSVLGQATIARLTMTEQVLDDMKRMLDFYPHAGLQMLHFSVRRPSLLLGSALRLERFIATCHVTDLPMFSGRFSTP